MNKLFSIHFFFLYKFILFQLSLNFLSQFLSLICFLCVRMQSFKDILLESENVESATVADGEAPIMSDSEQSLSIDAKLESDPPGPSTFPEAIIFDDVTQVKKDIDDLSKTCLVGKIMGAVVDLRTIMFI